MPIRFSCSLPIPEGAEVPTEFRIWQWGETKTQKGSVNLDRDAAAAVLSAFSEHGIELAIDYEHQTFNSSDNGKPAPAAGWFVPEVRDDGLWASQVRWTDEAAGYLKTRQYRYFSPVALLDAKTRKPVRLMPMALTNWPATKHIEPLVARDEVNPKDGLMDELLEALGLKDKAELLSAVSKLVSFERDVIVLAGAKSSAEAFGVITALKAKAEQSDAVSAELASIKASAAQSETKSLIDAAVQEGRCDAAKRAELEQLQAKYGTDALRTTLSMLRKPAAEAVPPKGEAGIAGVLSASQIELIKKIGVDPAAVAKHKAQSPGYRAPNSENE